MLCNLLAHKAHLKTEKQEEYGRTAQSQGAPKRGAFLFARTFLFENTPLSALVVYKRDSVTGAALPNCRFQLSYLGGSTSGTGGTVIGTYVTSENGSFTVTGLKAGYYICEEVESDGAHVIDSAPQSFYISGEDQDIVTLYFGNAPKGAVLVKKVSSADNSPLSDVEFFVTTADGAVVGDANGKFVTDSAGSFLVEGVEPGTTLVIKETRAKPGYLLDDTPQTVQVKEGQTVTVEFRNQPLGNLVIEVGAEWHEHRPAGGRQIRGQIRQRTVCGRRRRHIVLQRHLLHRFHRKNHPVRAHRHRHRDGIGERGGLKHPICYSVYHTV